MDIATAVPAGSTCKLVCAPLTVVAPVPPFAKANVPAKVIVPDVVIGPPVVVKPVVPPDTFTLDTVPVVPASEAKTNTAPVLSLAYSFLSYRFNANSPSTKLPAVGAAAGVEL